MRVLLWRGRKGRQTDSVTDKLFQFLPPEGFKILLTLFLCFLLGLEREEHRATDQRYSFGGVRTFPLIGLTGYAMAFLSGPQLLPLTFGFGVIGAFLWLSYRHKLETYNEAGVTTEISGLVTYVVGALVSRDQFWIATTIAVLSMLLLELKDFLENLSTKIPAVEILTFTKFLLLTFVILPIVPDKDFGPYRVNPFKAWLVVVAISGVSYGSYLLEKVAKGKGGVRLSALLGGLYSSTFTTVVMAKEAKTVGTPHAYAGSIVIASGVMYFRFLVLIGFFNFQLMRLLTIPFLVLGAIGMAGGWAWSAISDPPAAGKKDAYSAKNPLELSSAFLLGLVFLAVLVATNFALIHLGKGGIYGMAVISGLAPVDPFVMGLTQTAGDGTAMGLAVAGIVIAAASNNFAKAFIALALADRKTGKQSMVLMLALTALGLVPLLWTRPVGARNGRSGNRNGACGFLALCAAPGGRFNSGGDASPARLDRRVSSFARLSESSGARVCSFASARSAFLLQRVLPLGLGRVSLSGDGRVARRARAALSHRDGGAHISQPLHPRAARRGLVFSSAGAAGCGSRVSVVAADRVQRLFPRRISEFRFEHCGGFPGAWAMAAMAGEAGNGAMDCGAGGIHGGCISRT